MAPDGIVVKNLWKTFDGHPVLKGISLDIPLGQSVVILGPSGCGKSVFLKCLLGLIPYDKGSVLIEGHRIDQETATQEKERFSKSGVVFQSGALLDSYTVLENITFRNPSLEAKEHAFELLKKIGLSPDVAHCMPEEISGGMKRRVALARAVINNPAYIFFDEPTEGLDPISADAMACLIRDFITDMEATALTISHTLRSAKDIADRVVVFDEGTLAWQGTIDEMRTTSCDLVQRFIHTSQFL